MSVRAWFVAGVVGGIAMVAAPAIAAVHGEAGDAPDLPFGQITNGVGPLLRIYGNLTDDLDVDMYCVVVPDLALFSATVVGAAGFDTQLFLFKGPGCGKPPCPPIGTGITHNDDAPPGGPDADDLQSTITSAFLPTSPSIYLLAISAFDRDPVGVGGLIWGDDFVNLEYPPDGPGAPSTVSGWTELGLSSGEYWILLSGCEPCSAVPQPETWIEEDDAPEGSGQPVVGSGPVVRIFGDLSDGNDVDGYRIRITDPATFSAVTSGAVHNDTELSLFTAGLGGIAFNDDDDGTVFSRLSSAFIPSSDVYVLHISEYDRSATGPGLARIWEPLPANVERTPDGPGAPGPLMGWSGAGFDGGFYGIRLTGAEFVSTTDVPGDSPPAGVNLEIHPNPFHAATTIGYRLPQTANVRLEVYDLAGRWVRTLVQERQPAGAHSVSWDGRDSNGRHVAAGVYALRLESDGEASAGVRRVVVIR
jgi:hypothetical protein